MPLFGPGRSPFLQGTQRFVQLDPTEPRQLLAGMDTIRRDLRLPELRFTQADLANHRDWFGTQRYGDRHGFNPLPLTVGDYLRRNFSSIARNDGDATNITFADVFQRQGNLPDNVMMPPPAPPAPPPPPAWAKGAHQG